VVPSASRSANWKATISASLGMRRSMKRTDDVQNPQSPS
jgi:hypothetical protein